MPDWAINLFSERFVETLPWLIVAVVVCWSPLGRGLLGRARKSRDDDASLKDVLDELAALRANLGEALERLDYSERQFSALQHGQPVEERVPTPI